MTDSKLAEISMAGAAARRDELSFYTNPHNEIGMDWATVEHMLAWHDKACAWAAGWLRQDEGRDAVLARMLSQRSL